MGRQLRTLGPSSSRDEGSRQPRPGIARPAAGLGGLAVLLGFACVAVLPSRAAAQTLEEYTATPEGAAELFLRSVRAIRWEIVAAAMHDEVLTRFHETVTMVADSDPTGELRRDLVGVDSATLAALEPDAAFARAIGAVIEDMPGLMHAIYDRDDEVLGSVPEGDDLAHVVYRTSARLSGAVPEVKVMQLRRRDSGWRVLWSDELEVLAAALRGVPRTRR